MRETIFLLQNGKFIQINSELRVKPYFCPTDDCQSVLSDLIDLYEGSSPLEIEKATTAARWKWLDEAVGYNLFSKEAVFAYAVKIADVERWLTLTPEEGRVKLDELLEQLHQNIKKITREENS